MIEEHLDTVQKALLCLSNACESLSRNIDALNNELTPGAKARRVERTRAYVDNRIKQYERHTAHLRNRINKGQTNEY